MIPRTMKASYLDAVSTVRLADVRQVGNPPPHVAVGDLAQGHVTELRQHLIWVIVVSRRARVVARRS